MLKWKIGDVSITQILEWSSDKELGGLIPAATHAAILPIGWLRPDFANDAGALRFNLQAFLLETPELRIIVDTCIGNDKDRPIAPFWHKMQTSFLQHLTAAGCARETIDLVLCTHLHLDHVGWNTMLDGDRWIPTFPNARYLFGRVEYEHFRSDDSHKTPAMRALDATVLADSIAPIFEAGLVDLVEVNHVVSSEIKLVPTIGHTPGHVSVQISSRGEAALITGDFAHHPCQLAHPDWYSVADLDPGQSSNTRHAMFSDLAGKPVLVIGSHWSGPVAGRIVRDGGAFRLVY